MAEIILRITPQGKLIRLYDERLDLQELGRASIRRASHVEPDDTGQWTADMSRMGGPVLGPFPQRSEALRKEVDWLSENIL